MCKFRKFNNLHQIFNLFFVKKGAFFVKKGVEMQVKRGEEVDEEGED